jgi:hypothetical protein
MIGQPIDLLILLMPSPRLELQTLARNTIDVKKLSCLTLTVRWLEGFY